MMPVARIVKNIAKDILQYAILRGKFVWRLPSQQRQAVALTFDDGPHPIYTDKIRCLLKSRNIKATFFVLGKNVEQHRSIVEALAADGHCIENHGYSHSELPHLSKEDMLKEIEGTKSLIASITGKESRFVRPPRGKISLRVLRSLAEKKHCVMLWTRTSNDYKKTGVRNILDSINPSTVTPGSILLFHDNNPYTVEALGAIIDAMKDKYTFIALDEYRLANCE